jgi:hypothetical protein
MQTEAMARYTGDFHPAQKVNKKNYVYQSIPFSGTTTHQDDYAFYKNHKPREASQLARGNNGIFDANLPFSGMTTNNSDYQNWKSKPAQSMRKTREVVISEDDRDFQTEASKQFRFSNARPRQSCRPSVKNIANQPFTGETTHQADYRRVGQPVAAKAFKRDRKYRPRAEERSFETETRAHFITYEPHRCPAEGIDVTRKREHGHVFVEQMPNGTWRKTATASHF